MRGGERRGENRRLVVVSNAIGYIWKISGLNFSIFPLVTAVPLEGDDGCAGKAGARGMRMRCLVGIDKKN